jgi:hypothetical protein
MRSMIALLHDRRAPAEIMRRYQRRPGERIPIM